MTDVIIHIYPGRGKEEEREFYNKKEQGISIFKEYLLEVFGHVGISFPLEKKIYGFGPIITEEDIIPLRNNYSESPDSMRMRIKHPWNAVNFLFYEDSPVFRGKVFTGEDDNVFFASHPHIEIPLKLKGMSKKDALKILTKLGGKYGSKFQGEDRENCLTAIFNYLPLYYRNDKPVVLSEPGMLRNTLAELQKGIKEESGAAAAKQGGRRRRRRKTRRRKTRRKKRRKKKTRKKRGGTWVGEVCPICQEKMKRSGATPIVQTTGCVGDDGINRPHTFHLNCINGWLNRGNITCPMCRHVINSDLRTVYPTTCSDKCKQKWGKLWEDVKEKIKNIRERRQQARQQQVQIAPAAPVQIDLNEINERSQERQQHRGFDAARDAHDIVRDNRGNLFRRRLSGGKRRKKKTRKKRGNGGVFSRKRKNISSREPKDEYINLALTQLIENREWQNAGVVEKNRMMRHLALKLEDDAKKGGKRYKKKTRKKRRKRRTRTRRKRKGGTNPTTDNCPICLDPLNEGTIIDVHKEVNQQENPPTAGANKHYYHLGCIKESRSYNCPSCRKRMTYFATGSLPRARDIPLQEYLSHWNNTTVEQDVMRGTVNYHGYYGEEGFNYPCCSPCQHKGICDSIFGCGSKYCYACNNRFQPDENFERKCRKDQEWVNGMMRNTRDNPRGLIAREADRRRAALGVRRRPRIPGRLMDGGKRKKKKRRR